MCTCVFVWEVCSAYVFWAKFFPHVQREQVGKYRDWHVAHNNTRTGSIPIFTISRGESVSQVYHLLCTELTVLQLCLSNMAPQRVFQSPWLYSPFYAENSIILLEFLFFCLEVCSYVKIQMPFKPHHCYIYSYIDWICYSVFQVFILIKGMKNLN